MLMGEDKIAGYKTGNLPGVREHGAYIGKALEPGRSNRSVYEMNCQVTNCKRKSHKLKACIILLLEVRLIHSSEEAE